MYSEEDRAPSAIAGGVVVGGWVGGWGVGAVAVGGWVRVRGVGVGGAWGLGKVNTVRYSTTHAHRSTYAAQHFSAFLQSSQLMVIDMSEISYRRGAALEFAATPAPLALAAGRTPSSEAQQLGQPAKRALAVRHALLGDHVRPSKDPRADGSHHRPAQGQHGAGRNAAAAAAALALGQQQ